MRAVVRNRAVRGEPLRGRAGGGAAAAAGRGGTDLRTAEGLRVCGDGQQLAAALLAQARLLGPGQRCAWVGSERASVRVSHARARARAARAQMRTHLHGRDVVLL